MLMSTPLIFDSHLFEREPKNWFILRKMKDGKRNWRRCYFSYPLDCNIQELSMLKSPPAFNKRGHLPNSKFVPPPCLLPPSGWFSPLFAPKTSVLCSMKAPITLKSFHYRRP